VCSGAHVDLGADRVVDRTTTDFTQNDLVFDAVGDQEIVGYLSRLVESGS
jgi:hypothetical protein